MPWRGDGWFPRRDGHLYNPNPGQAAFHASPARFRALVGGRGSGKTTAGAQAALAKIRKGEPGAVLNPDFENFKISTWPEFRQWIPWSHVIARDRHMGELGWEPSKPFVLHFDNGATVLCKGLKDPDSARGPNINWLWYDEGGRDKDGLAWLTAIASVRIGADPRAWVTSTPRGVRHWLYRSFALNEISAEVHALLDEIGHDGPLYEHFHASIHDNRANLDPLFLATMLTAYTGRFARQELGGEFVEMAEGVVYDEFSVENIVSDQEPDPDIPIELAFDDGYVDPRAFLFIQRRGTEILVFDEHYRSRQLAEMAVKEVVERVERWIWPLDEERRAQALKEAADGKRRILPEIAVGSPEAKELRERLRRADIPVRSRPHEVVEGINVARRLVLDGNGYRALKVHSRCKNFIEELTDGYRYPDEGARKNNEKPMDGNDHACDAFRYWAWVRAR